MCPEYFFLSFSFSTFLQEALSVTSRTSKKYFVDKKRTTSVMISKDPVNYLELQKNT